MYVCAGSLCWQSVLAGMICMLTRAHLEGAQTGAPAYASVNIIP